MGIIALHAGHKRDRQASAQERIFAIGFLAAPPAWIAKDVDVGCPEIQAFENVGVACTHVLRMFDSALNANSRRHLVNARHIERGSKTDGFGKLRDAVRNDAVQGFAPPIVRRNVQARDGACLIHEL